MLFLKKELRSFKVNNIWNKGRYGVQSVNSEKLKMLVGPLLVDKKSCHQVWGERRLEETICVFAKTNGKWPILAIKRRKALMAEEAVNVFVGKKPTN
jgi:hypothetical protein